MNRTPTVAAVIAGDLAAYGARCCFGLIGTANFKISHALVEAGVELISARHECNAASMGDAYAKATGELTLVSVHSGPGLTNALTGIGARRSARKRVPCPGVRAGRTRDSNRARPATILARMGPAASAAAPALNAVAQEKFSYTRVKAEEVREQMSRRPAAEGTDKFE